MTRTLFSQNNPKPSYTSFKRYPFLLYLENMLVKHKSWATETETLFLKEPFPFQYSSFLCPIKYLAMPHKFIIPDILILNTLVEHGISWKKSFTGKGLPGIFPLLMPFTFTFVEGCLPNLTGRFTRKYGLGHPFCLA